MMLVIRDTQDRLQAAVDYYLVNAQGQIDAKGTYLFINQMDCNLGSGRDSLRRITDRFLTDYPQAVAAYWRREDRTGMRLHQYRRHQFDAYRQKEVMCHG